MKMNQAARRLNSIELYWLAVAMSLVILPHAVRLPGWIPVMYFLLLLWRLIGPVLNWPLPNREQKLLHWCQNILALFCLLGIYASYHSIVGRDPGVALLVLLSGFKLLESELERDFYILVCLGYIMVTTNFLYTQSIPVALFMALVTLILTASFITVNDHNKKFSIKNKLKLAGLILLYAIPLMLVLFVFFPRISGPLWRMPQDANTGKTGISDTMSPGSISQLLQSDELAFRVQFTDTPPPASQMYWRGPVLWFTDGRQWRRNLSLLKTKQKINFQKEGKTTAYNITIEPTDQHWLYGLEMAIKSTRGDITGDMQIIIKDKINHRVRYEMESMPVYKLFEKVPENLENALQLEPGMHPKTLALAQQWRQQNLDNRQIIDSALTLFSDEEFYYTLQPPLLRGDAVDDFLFQSKRGFCEHYASSFVVLMRAAGIPARVITGYQGASYNPVGDYYNVYQRDAHAWAEVYLEEKGWLRVDPTAAVSPERILEGIENALPEIAPNLIFNTDSSLAYALLQNLRDSWDAINYQWNLWVLGYSPKRQMDFLNKLGLAKFGYDWQTLTVGLFVILSTMMVLFGLLLLRPNGKSNDPARNLYDAFCKKMARIGVERHAYEGPMDFYQRVGSEKTILKKAVLEITECYVAVRYASDQEQLTRLKQLIHSFKPGSLLTKKPS